MTMEESGYGIIALVIMAIIAVVVISACQRDDKDEGQSLYLQSLYGKWRVRYPDGSLSQRLHRATAEAYAQAHGGELEEAEKQPRPEVDDQAARPDTDRLDRQTDPATRRH